MTNLDASLFRAFKITERFTAQLRGEALNLTNTPHFSNPGSNVSTTNTSGVITGTSAPTRLFDGDPSSGAPSQL